MGLRRVGSGPVLSLAILLAVTDEATAERFLPAVFKWSVVAPIEAARWALDAGDVLGWLDSAAAGTDDVVRLVVRRAAAAAGDVSGLRGRRARQRGHQG